MREKAPMKKNEMIGRDPQQKGSNRTMDDKGKKNDGELRYTEVQDKLKPGGLCREKGKMGR